MGDIAYSPAVWREMFAACGDNLGLNLDPSRLVSR